MDMRELLEPVYPEDDDRSSWPLVVGAAAVVMVAVMGAVLWFGGSDEPMAQPPGGVSTTLVASDADDGSGDGQSEAASETTVTSSTLVEGATTPEEAVAAAMRYIEIEDDPEAIEEFFSEIDRFVYFITVLRNPNEIARYTQRHAPNTSDYEIVGDPTPTSDGTVILDVNYRYGTNQAEVTWEIEVTDGKVTQFIADGR